MKVLVVGAAGLLGRALTRQLISNGYQVVGWGTKTEIGERQCPIHPWHIDAPIPEGTDTLITVFQPDHRPADGLGKLYDDNFYLHYRLWKSAAKAGVRRVIHASTGSVYGHTSPRPLQEDQVLPKAESHYTASKKAAEECLELMAHHFQATVIFRPFFLFGPQQKNNMLLPRIIQNLKEGQAIRLAGKNGIKLNPIFVEDAAKAFLEAFQLEGSHLFNLAGPKIITFRELAAMLGRVIDQDPRYQISDEPVVDWHASTRRLDHYLTVPKTSLEKAFHQTLFPEVTR